MSDSHLASRIEKNERDIDDLRRLVNQNEKSNAATEVSIKYLSETIKELSVSINSFSADVKNILYKMETFEKYIENNKGIGHFFKENWFRIPTMVVLFYAIIYAVGMFDDKGLMIKKSVNQTMLSDTPIKNI